MTQSTRNRRKPAAAPTAKRREQERADDASLVQLRETEIVWTAEKVSALRDNVCLILAGTKDDIVWNTAARIINWLSAELVEVFGDKSAAMRVIKEPLSTERVTMKFTAPLEIKVSD